MLERAFKAAKENKVNQGAIQKFAIREAQEMLRRAGVVDPRLDAQTPQSGEPKASKKDLRQQTSVIEPIRYPIEIPEVSEELYRQTREAVEATGYTFVASIRSVSMDDLIAEDAIREQRRIGYVNDSKAMRSTVPPEMEVAINPARFRIEGSNRLSIEDQKKIIKKEEVEWMKKLPEAVRPLVSMRMIDPSAISQLEDAYMDSTGELILPDYFARTDVQTVRGSVATVGRVVPSFRRGVDGWGRDGGVDFVFAVSVVVLPRKLAA